MRPAHGPDRWRSRRASTRRWCPTATKAGITEPVARFLRPMLVDIGDRGRRNYYFYQQQAGAPRLLHHAGPSVVGTDRRETSTYLPMI